MDCVDGRDADLRRETNLYRDDFEEKNAPWVTHNETRRCENLP
jgi:hypothetical protein